MFVVLKKSRVLITLSLAAVLVCAAVLGYYGATDAEAAALKEERKIPVYSVETDKNVVAISFDAAWGSDKTLKILDILDEYGVKATFFLVGFWIDAYPELVKEISDRGHLIGDHSENHPHFNTLSKEAMQTEVLSVADKVEKITGKRPVFFRAPYGEYNNTLMTVLEENGITGVQWNVDSLDWKGLSGGKIADRILSKVDKGSIILCHNNSDHILDALPIVLTGLKNKNLTLVRMDELVMTENYNIDSNGTQHSATT
jgi:peptidoglycan/xylan/chitin deacetylase (PgdA/CDA1 family)